MYKYIPGQENQLTNRVCLREYRRQSSYTLRQSYKS